MAKAALNVAVLMRVIESNVREQDGTLRLFIEARPGSKRDALEEGPAGQLLLRIRAPAVDGKANERIIDLLSKFLGVPKKKIELAKGEHSKIKEIRIAGMSKEALFALWDLRE